MVRNYFRTIQHRVGGYPRWLRLLIGLLLLLGGILGFLPILGFWMFPLGLLVLSSDVPLARRWRRRSEIKWLRRWRRHFKRGRSK